MIVAEYEERRGQSSRKNSGGQAAPVIGGRLQARGPGNRIVRASLPLPENIPLGAEARRLSAFCGTSEEAAEKLPAFDRMRVQQGLKPSFV